MSKNQSNDQGYKLVMKEYDFYNNNDNDDFEIIEDIPTNYITTASKETNISNNNINSKFSDPIKNSTIVQSQKKLENFVVDAFKIIFYSRNKLSEFTSQSKLKLNEDKKNDNPFGFGVEELIAYDNLKYLDERNDNKKQQYIIDFFLYENNNNDTKIFSSLKANGNKKLLVERWKINYKENCFKINDNNDPNYLKYLETKIKLIEKSIILYSRLFPLYNIIKDNKYYIEFKFNPTSKDKKKFIEEKMTKKLKIKMEELFDFKLSITYLKITPENIDIFFKRNNDDFVIIPSKKSRRRFLSADYKKSSSQLLLQKNNEEERKEEKKEENNNKKTKNDLIIEDYFNDMTNDDNEDDIIKKGRLSAKVKKVKSKFFDQDNEDDSITDEEDDSSGENLSLIISESNGSLNKKLSKNVNNNSNKDNKEKEKYIKDNKKLINKEKNIVRKCSTFRENSKNEIKEEDNIKNIEFKNSKITKIVKEYKNIKKMMMMMPYYGNINCNKLSTYISNN
jgi:hypothetical protein